MSRSQTGCGFSDVFELLQIRRLMEESRPPDRLIANTTKSTAVRSGRHCTPMRSRSTTEDLELNVDCLWPALGYPWPDFETSVQVKR
jgi:hypothetical protein